MTDSAVTEAPVDRLLTPEEVRVRLGYTHKRQVLEMIVPKQYGLKGPPALEAISLKREGQVRDRWRVFESELNRFLNSLKRNKKTRSRKK